MIIASLPLHWMLQTRRLTRLYSYSLRVRKCRSHHILSVLHLMRVLWRPSPYLQRHLDEHEQLLDADPDPLPFELVCDVSPLFICEAPQQLRRGNKGRWRFSSPLPKPSNPPWTKCNKERAPLKNILWTIFTPLIFFQLMNRASVVFFQSIHEGYDGHFEAVRVRQCVLLRKGSGGV